MTDQVATLGSFKRLLKAPADQDRFQYGANHLNDIGKRILYWTEVVCTGFALLVYEFFHQDIEQHNVKIKIEDLQELETLTVRNLSNNLDRSKFEFEWFDRTVEFEQDGSDVTMKKYVDKIDSQGQKIVDSDRQPIKILKETIVLRGTDFKKIYDSLVTKQWEDQKQEYHPYSRGIVDLQPDDGSRVLYSDSGYFWEQYF